MKLSKTLLTIAVASAPVVVNAIELEDYTVANSSYSDAFVSGTFSAIEPSGDNPNDQIGFSYTIDADYQTVFSTLPRSWGYSVGLNANGNKPSTETVAVTDVNGVTTSVDTETTTDTTFTLDGNIDTYFHKSQYPQAFWFGQGAYATSENLPDDNLSATLGIGYGRVYNATPLAKVIRIVEELNEQGLLTGPIPDSIALETAEIIDREDEFKSRFGDDDFEPEFYAAIEASLAKSGALLDGKLGALGSLSINDVLEDEPISNRRHGWVVRLGAGFQASDLSGLADNDPKLLFQFEYAKPFGTSSQFINLFSFEPVFGDSTLTNFTNDMSYTYEVSDTIDWVSSWSLTYSNGDDEQNETFETTTNIISSRYSFDLGNKLDYFVGVRLSQFDVDPNPPGSFGDDPEITLESGFSYRLK